MLKEVSFKLIHKGVCVGRGHFCAHGCAMDLLKDFVAKGEYIFFEHEVEQSFHVLFRERERVVNLHS